MFTELKTNLSEKVARVAVAEAKLKDLHSEEDIITWFTNNLLGKEFILFCGAGISIAGTSSAPGFLELRDALINAIARLLKERRVISAQQEVAVSEALRSLPKRVDIIFPPEMIFGFVRDALGTDVVMSLLSCLDEGTPNENHIAIQRLAERKDSGLLGVITSNFDTYIERAFGGVNLSRLLPKRAEEGEGFPLLKPHGTLDEQYSIIVTLTEVSLRLDDVTRDAFKHLVTNRRLVVIGYSGWDYDLFPLLVHAGRHWNTQIVWVLWNEKSMNAQVAKIQIALGDRCTVLNGQGRAVLAELVDLKISNPPMRRRRDLIIRFTEAMSNCSNTALISALTGVVDPIGVPKNLSVREQLLSALLGKVLDEQLSDIERLKHLHMAASYSEDRGTRTLAIMFGKMVAKRLGLVAWLRQFDYLKTVNPANDDVEGELNEIEFSLRENFFPRLDELPDPDRAKQSLTLHSLIRGAELLLQAEEFDEAEKLARRLLVDTSFPESGVSKGAWMIEDGKAEGKLHKIIAELYLEQGNIYEAEKELCLSLDISWRELDFFEFDFVLDIARRIASWQSDQECYEMAWSLSTRIPKLLGDNYTELENLIWKLDDRSGDQQDLARAKLLFSQMRDRIGNDNQNEFSEVLERLTRIYSS